MCLSDFIIFYNASVSYNKAYTAGGGAFMSGANIAIDQSIFTNNYATDSGGALFFLSSTDISIRNCELLYSRSGSGGAIFVIGSESMQLHTNVFSNNYALAFGGAFFSLLTEYLYIADSHFISNKCGFYDGGALYISRTTHANFTYVTFTSNKAPIGGAISMTYSYYVFISNSNFYNCTATESSGSAIWLTSTELTFLDTNTFAFNAAPKGGGTIYWQSTSTMSEPAGMDDNVMMYKNTARYGPYVATEGVMISIEGSSSPIEIENYELKTIPSLYVIVQDYYEQHVLIETKSATMEISASTQYCHGNVATVSGSIVESVTSGTAVFDNLQATCAPGGTMILNASYKISTALSLIETLDAGIKLQFRKCYRGEYYTEKECIKCSNGSYSLADNSDLSVTECTSCPSNSETCFADKIKSSPGYWRISDSATTLLKCPLTKQSCIGGFGTGDELCEVGYSGNRMTYS
jgi:predicted outer membrane repeat protein